MSQLWRCRECGDELLVEWDGYPQPACSDCDPYRPMVKVHQSAVETEVNDGGPGTPFARITESTDA